MSMYKWNSMLICWNCSEQLWKRSHKRFDMGCNNQTNLRYEASLVLISLNWWGLWKILWNLENFNQPHSTKKNISILTLIVPLVISWFVSQFTIFLDHVYPTTLFFIYKYVFFVMWLEHQTKRHQRSHEKNICPSKSFAWI